MAEHLSFATVAAYLIKEVNERDEVGGASILKLPSKLFGRVLRTAGGAYRT